MSPQHPPFSTSLTSLAESVARTVRADPGERMRRLKLIAGTTASVVLIGWAAGVGAQTPTPPPLPPAVQSDPAQGNAAPAAQQPPQQAAAAPANNAATTNAAGNSASGLPPLPLGQDGVREVQSQLIALGFNPGAADGVAGPATLAAARQFNESRGYGGPVPIDAWLLTRLQQDPGPRLTPEQVAARSQPRAQASRASNPPANAIRRFGAKLDALLNGGH